MVRNVLGSILALAGATAAVRSPFRAWYDGRLGRHFRIGELFSGAGITDAKAELFGSLFLPFAFAALLTLIGVVLRSRLLVAVAGVLVLGFTVLWMVRQGQAEGSLAVAGDGSGLGQGLLSSFGGGVALLLGAAVMTGRAHGRGRGRGFGRRAPAERDPAAPADPSTWQDQPSEPPTWQDRPSGPPAAWQRPPER
ncbi:hypothetical protein [Streptomyces sp. KL118A]|uniref:hypothetical protein n=1 Tax=Streptomyces sp. KL118A TaxID=3045153 RepID=UPI00278BE7BB|nr:hypothetical protein [Streptomyces sp. KL118A]